MTTCLRWILGYMRLEIWHKISLSADCDVFAQRYTLVVVHATIGLDWNNQFQDFYRTDNFNFRNLQTF